MKSSQLHVNSILTNISVAYKAQGHIADELSPAVTVVKESDLYFVYGKDTMSLPETIRADKAESNMATFNVSTASYTLQFHGIKDLVSDRQRENADKPLQPDVDTTEFLTDVIKLRREVDLQAIVQTAANWANATSLTSTLAWNSNTVTSNPITFVDSATSVVLLNSAKRPNTVVMNDLVFNAVKEHQSIVDRIKYTSADSVSPQMIARLFRIDKILVPEVTYNTADEGAADSMSRVWNDTVFIGYIDPKPAIKKVTALTTFWQSRMGKPYVTKKWREEKNEADAIEVNAAFQNKVIASDCAYLIVDTIQ